MPQPKTKEVKTKARAGEQCVGRPLVERAGRYVQKPCENKATTSREGWRWGNKSKGEGLIVRVQHPLCVSCARTWDDNEAEGAAEAAAS